MKVLSFVWALMFVCVVQPGWAAETVVLEQERCEIVPLSGESEGKSSSEDHSNRAKSSDENSLVVGKKGEDGVGRTLLRVDLTGIGALQDHDIESLRILIPYRNTSDEDAVVVLYPIDEENRDWNPTQANWERKDEGEKWVGGAGLSRAIEQDVLAKSSRLNGRGFMVLEVPPKYLETCIGDENINSLNLLLAEESGDVRIPLDAKCGREVRMEIRPSGQLERGVVETLEEADGIRMEEAAVCRESDGGITVGEGDIEDGRYTYRLTYDDMGEQGKFMDDLCAHLNLWDSDGIVREAEFPRGKPAGDDRDRWVSPESEVERAEFVYKFDFTETNYRPAKVIFREHLKVSDRRTQDIRGTVAYRTEDTGWRILREHRSDDSYSSVQSNELQLQGPDVVYYRVSFEPCEDDAEGQLMGYQNEWNRIPYKGSRVPFKADFAVKRVQK